MPRFLTCCLVKLRSLRVAEALAMTGFVFVVPLTSRGCTVESLSLNATLFSAAIVAHFTAIYAWNSYLGYANDALNARLTGQLALKRSTFRWIATVLTIGSVFIYFFAVGSTVALAGLLSIALWLWYSAPGFGLKEIPFAGTMLHVISGALHGAMALIAFGCFAHQNLLIALWFGMLFASGHLVHEAIDREADARAGVRTACVRYGYKAFAIILIGVAPMMTAVAGLLVMTSATSTGFVAFVVTSFLHTAFVWYELRPLVTAEIEQEADTSNRREKFVTLQRKYRMLYAAAGVIAVVLFLGV